MIRKIIESHQFVFVTILLYMTMAFATKLGYEAANGKGIFVPKRNSKGKVIIDYSLKSDILKE
jgi:hypothetical protein